MSTSDLLVLCVSFEFTRVPRCQIGLTSTIKEASDTWRDIELPDSSSGPGAIQLLSGTMIEVDVDKSVRQVGDTVRNLFVGVHKLSLDCCITFKALKLIYAHGCLNDIELLTAEDETEATWEDWKTPPTRTVTVNEPNSTNAVNGVVLTAMQAFEEKYAFPKLDKNGRAVNFGYTPAGSEYLNSCLEMVMTETNGVIDVNTVKDSAGGGTSHAWRYYGSQLMNEARVPKADRERHRGSAVRNGENPYLEAVVPSAQKALTGHTQHARFHTTSQVVAEWAMQHLPEAVAAIATCLNCHKVPVVGWNTTQPLQSCDNYAVEIRLWTLYRYAAHLLAVSPDLLDKYCTLFLFTDKGSWFADQRTVFLDLLPRIREQLKNARSFEAPILPSVQQHRDAELSQRISNGFHELQRHISVDMVTAITEALDKRLTPIQQNVNTIMSEMSRTPSPSVGLLTLPPVPEDGWDGGAVAAAAAADAARLARMTECSIAAGPGKNNTPAFPIPIIGCDGSTASSVHHAFAVEGSPTLYELEQEAVAEKKKGPLYRKKCGQSVRQAVYRLNRFMRHLDFLHTKWGLDTMAKTARELDARLKIGADLEADHPTSQTCSEISDWTSYLGALEHSTVRTKKAFAEHWPEYANAEASRNSKVAK